MLELLQRDPLAFAVAALVLLAALVLHELAHAAVADAVGDPTARNAGRITLDPLRHLDPLGTVLLLAVGFGWARPVPIRPDLFRHRRSGLLLVSLAGPASNLALALLSFGALRLLRDLSAAPNEGAAGVVALGLIVSARINVLLAVFNLIPVPPLDGSKVLAALLPAPLDGWLMRLERGGFVLVIALIVLFDDAVFGLVDAVTETIGGWILGPF